MQSFRQYVEDMGAGVGFETGGPGNGTVSTNIEAPLVRLLKGQLAWLQHLPPIQKQIAVQAFTTWINAEGE